jgi:hypothetical protein
MRRPPRGIAGRERRGHRLGGTQRFRHRRRYGNERPEGANASDTSWSIRSKRERTPKSQGILDRNAIAGPPAESRRRPGKKGVPGVMTPAHGKSPPGRLTWRAVKDRAERERVCLSDSWCLRGSRALGWKGPARPRMKNPTRPKRGGVRVIREGLTHAGQRTACPTLPLPEQPGSGRYSILQRYGRPHNAQGVPPQRAGGVGGSTPVVKSPCAMGGPP